jgi:hypothetical protein
MPWPVSQGPAVASHWSAITTVDCALAEFIMKAPASSMLTMTASITHSD